MRNEGGRAMNLWAVVLSLPEVLSVRGVLDKRRKEIKKEDLVKLVDMIESSLQFWFSSLILEISFLILKRLMVLD